MRRDSNMKFGSYEPKHFELLDQLPPVIRRALAEADYHWQAGWVLEHYLATRSVADTIALIRKTDVDRHAAIARKEKRTVFGHHSRPIHPRAA